MGQKQFLDGSELRRVRRAAAFGRIAAVAIFVLVVGCVGLRAAQADAPKPDSLAAKGSARGAVNSGGGDLYALVVGLSKYHDAKIPKLELSDKDAKAFGDFLQTQNKVFKQAKVTYLLNEKATKAEVEKYLYYTLPKAGKDDTIILFFSGHGAYDPLRPKDFLFLTYDAEPEYLGTSAVKMSGLEFLKGINAERVLIIADACHAGGFQGGFSEMKPKAVVPSLELFLREAKNSSGTAIITSTSEKQLSWEIPNLKNSVFTHNLLEGLRGKADKDHDGVVTISEAYEYAYARTKDATKGYQHVQFEGRVVGQFPLSFVGAPLGALEAKKSLFDAVKSGNLLRVEQLLNAGSEVDPRDLANDTPLIAAARNGHVEVMKLLLSKGADLGAINHARMGPLAAAAEKGHGKAISLLLDKGADVNGKNQDGLTPLTLAAREGHLEAAKLLLEEGAEVKTRGGNGETALMLAASNGHAPVVQLLLEWQASLDAADLEGRTAAIHAARTGQRDVVKLLVARGAKIGMKRSRYLDVELVTATLVGDHSRMKELLTMGASPNAETQCGDTLLTLASGLGNAKAARILLAGGADVNLNGGGRTPLMAASAAGRTDLVQILLEAGAQIDLADKEGDSAVVLAARNGRAEALQELLDRLPPHIDASNQKNHALILAAENASVETIRVLLASGADVNSRDKAGDTPLIYAARSGHKDIVKLLLAREVDINARNNQKCTALMAAARQGRASVVKQLLVAGADASAEDWEGKTAQMLASEQEFKDVLEALKAR
jgi:ankyrin repeat protein